MATRLARWQWVVLGCMAAVLLLGAVLSVLGPQLRPWFVRESNARLRGYSLDIGAVAFRPWSLTLVFRDVVVRQSAHPRPAVLAVPRLEVDVQWRALLRGRIVARSVIDSPALHLDVAQLRAEARDPVPLHRRGWQRLPELYPLDINAIVVRNGSLTYVAPDARRPLRLTQVQAWVENIRHVEAAGARYPSPVRLRAVVFDAGRARFDGNADFLRQARPVLRGTGSIDAVPLATLGPLLRGYPLRLGGGTLAARGAVEVGVASTQAHLARVTIDGLRADYLGGARPAARAALARAARAAQRASRDPALTLRMDRLLVRGEFGYVNLGREPAYRVFLDEATLDARDVTNRKSADRATLVLSGRLMGSGRASIRGVFQTGPGPPDFALDVRATGTPLRSLNPLLRAHARLDAAAGDFSLYSQVLVKDGRIRGYVKPLFRDVDLYDREQDADDGLLRQLYELIADGVRGILENRQRDQVGTLADLSGPVKDPQASIPQIVGNLARNAFVEAILPGFEREAAATRR